MKNEIDYLVEWAIWVHLDSKTDMELILLKGHLLLELILDATLSRLNLHKNKNYSFYKKTIILDKIQFKESIKKNFIVSSLKDINKLRNRLAHEFQFDIKDGELEIWALNILENLKGEKHTNYTFRTKIVHSFSIISRNILELAN